MRNCFSSLQIAELHFQSLQLEDENNKLSEKNIQNVADMEHLQKQLEELMEEREKREALPSEDKNMVTRVDGCCDSILVVVVNVGSI